MKRFIRSSIIKKAKNFKPFYTIMYKQYPTDNESPLDIFGNTLDSYDDDEYFEDNIGKYKTKEEAEKFLNKLIEQILSDNNLDSRLYMKQYDLTVEDEQYKKDFKEEKKKFKIKYIANEKIYNNIFGKILNNIRGI